MSSYIQPLERVLKSYLPTGAVLIQILDPEPHKAVFAADITGDQVAELTAIYRMNDELYLIVLMCRHGVWTVAANLRGQGYGVTSMTAVPIIHAGLNNLVVGWQIGAIWSKLSVYAWTPEGLQDATPVDMSYSYIDFVHVPGPGGGQTPIAIWIHDTGDAYRVDVLRYLDGRFVAAPDAYQSYYPVVVKYYERLTRQHPDYAYYWYYLADAQLRAGDPVAGLVSVRNAIHLEGTYPSRETLLELESRIIKAIELTRSGRSIDLFPASVKIIGGTKWGYINQAGQWIIAPQFEEANDYQANGLAIVSTMGKYGIIDRTGRYVVEPIYQSISPYSEHRAAVLDAEGFRLIDEKGHVLTRQAYPYISSVQHGRAVFNIASTTDSGSSRYGYLDAQGRVAIPAQYAEANDFDKNGKAVVKMNDREYALIGLQGQQLITYPYPFVGPQGDGLLAFQETSDGKYGYIDERGKAVIEPAYTSAFPFHDGRAIVNTAEDFKSQYGVINRQGQYIVQPEYNDIRDLGEGRFALGRAKNADQPYIGSIYAIANWDGGRLTDFLYDDISDYHDGLASVYDGQYTYFVDRFGKAAAGYPQVKGSGSLRLMPGGLIQAMVDLRLMYITKQGEVIWQQNTVIPLRPPYMVREGKYDPSPNYLVYYPQVMAW
ncbi:WG repeat-containing protein [Paenibacillus sp. JCM 10914]|uniref:WG repeat-containing protein n=1 Tax=Paenibacillus sp. JCM 10914 TaxID=1236974 RepID=UPI0003CC5999|nr:hypothetical protein JCM10914_1622 [Paenibacillus sp. JCM 10914]